MGSAPWVGVGMRRELCIPGMGPFHPFRWTSRLRGPCAVGMAMYKAHRTWHLPGQRKPTIIMYAAQNWIWRLPVLLGVLVGPSLRLAVTAHLVASEPRGRYGRCSRCEFIPACDTDAAFGLVGSLRRSDMVPMPRLHRQLAGKAAHHRNHFKIMANRFGEPISAVMFDVTDNLFFEMTMELTPVAPLFKSDCKSAKSVALQGYSRRRYLSDAATSV